jgi:hypothetical protein
VKYVHSMPACGATAVESAGACLFLLSVSLAPGCCLHTRLQPSCSLPVSTFSAAFPRIESHTARCSSCLPWDLYLWVFVPGLGWEY